MSTVKDAAELKKAMEQQFESGPVLPLRRAQWAEVDDVGRTLRRGYVLPGAPSADSNEWRKDQL